MTKASKKERGTWVSFLGSLSLLIAFAICGCSKAPDSRDFVMPIVANYYLVNNSPEDVEIADLKDGHPGVSSKVVAIAWNERFIIAKRQDMRSRGDFPGDNFQVPVPGRFNYWIIQTREPQRWGPLSEAEFMDRSKTLGISNLQLQDVDDVAAASKDVRYAN